MKKICSLFIIICIISSVFVSCNNVSDSYVIIEQNGINRLTLYNKEGCEKAHFDSVGQISVDKVNDTLVVFSWQAGASFATRQSLFFDCDTRMISQPFSYVLDYSDSLVVIGSSHQLVVKDIFSEDGFTYTIDSFSKELSNTVEPLISAELSADDNMISVIYLTGDNYSKATEIFDFSDKN